jgi:manganese/zinc/iron transport system substrate-binding protein
MTFLFRKDTVFIVFICFISILIWFYVHIYYATHAAKNTRLTVICTTSIIADLVHTLAGSDVIIKTLMGPGIDPHLYRACEGDVHRLANADIIFYNGLHLEGKMSHLLEHMNMYTCVYAVTDGIPRHLLHAPAEFEDTYDPHVWLDVSLWSYVTRHVSSLLVKHDPEHAHAYTIRTAAYIQTLQQLDAYIREKTAQLLPKKRILVTAHDAFNYFGAAYGFQVVGLQGMSTESEAGIKDIAHLASFLVTHQIQALFVESSISPRAIHAVQCATRARGFEVVIGPELFSDALGNSGTPEGTYVGMIKHNIDAIVGALGQGQ